MTQLHATLLIVGASIAHPRGQQAASICICIYVSKHHEPRFEEIRHAHMKERLRATRQIACYAGNKNAGAGNNQGGNKCCRSWVDRCQSKVPGGDRCAAYSSAEHPCNRKISTPRIHKFRRLPPLPLLRVRSIYILNTVMFSIWCSGHLTCHQRYHNEGIYAIILHLIWWH